jgi:hypothetical protein
LVLNWLIAFTFKEVITEPTGRFCGPKFWASAMEVLKIVVTINSFWGIEIFIPVNFQGGEFNLMLIEIQKKIGPSICLGQLS